MPDSSNILERKREDHHCLQLCLNWEIFGQNNKENKIDFLSLDF